MIDNKFCIAEGCGMKLFVRKNVARKTPYCKHHMHIRFKDEKIKCLYSECEKYYIKSLVPQSGYCRFHRNKILGFKNLSFGNKKPTERWEYGSKFVDELEKRTKTLMEDVSPMERAMGLSGKI